MILHCMICSRQGKHIGSHSAIAVVDIEKLDLPLDPLMFTSLMPERELPPPWQLGADGWSNMKCPRGNHLPWGIELDETDQAMKDGGPEKLLVVAKLWSVPEFIDIKKHREIVQIKLYGGVRGGGKSEEVNSFKMMSSSVVIDTEKNEIVEIDPLKCRYCPKVCKSLAGKMAHERFCKKKKGVKNAKNRT